jgi:hypothetical protein
MKTKTFRQVRLLLSFFIGALILSGLTAFPIQTEVIIANKFLQNLGFANALTNWIQEVAKGVNKTYGDFPFIAYGTDWLAFAHLAIAVAFIGPWRDPIKNIWIIEFGLIACAGIIPLAFIAGYVRGIPFFWQLIDCSFGAIGALVLLAVYQKTKVLIRMSS